MSKRRNASVVAEQELGDLLGQLGLADAGRPGEEQHAAGPRGVARRLRAGQAERRALEDVERLGDRELLALDRAADRLLALPDVLTDAAAPPRVVVDTQLVDPHRVGDVRDPAVPGQQRDLVHGAQRHALGRAREPARLRIVQGEPARERRDRLLPLVEGRHPDRDRANRLDARGEPGRQVPLPLH